LVVAGVAALAHRAAPLLSPSWGNLDPLSMFLPLLGTVLAPIAAYVTETLILLPIVFVLRRWPGAVWIWIVAGLAISGTAGIETMTSWLLLGTATGVVLMIAYTLVFRHQPALLIVSVATITILSTLRDGIQHPFPTALAGSILALALIALTASVWYKGYTST
jgi:hypothetical protein